MRSTQSWLRNGSSASGRPGSRGSSVTCRRSCDGGRSVGLHPRLMQLARLALTGQRVLDTSVLNGFGRSTFDFLLENGSFVDSKFGTSIPSGLQAQAIAAWGDQVAVQYWTYPTRLRNIRRRRTIRNRE